MIALTKGAKSYEVVQALADVPAGCVSEILSPTLIAHLLVRVSQSSLCSTVALVELPGLD